MDCSLPGPSIHGIFQARVLEWGAIEIHINDDTSWRAGFGWAKSMRPFFSVSESMEMQSWGIILYFINSRANYCFFWINLKNFFNWRIIALQNCVGFYQASAWISLRYTCVASRISLPPISLPIPPPRLLQSSCLSSLCLDVFLKHPFWIFGHKYSKLVLKKDKYKIHNLFCCKKSC